MSARERNLAHEALWSEAAELRNELRRPKLATPMTRALLKQPRESSLARPTSGSDAE